MGILHGGISGQRHAQARETSINKIIQKSGNHHHQQNWIKDVPLGKTKQNSNKNILI